MLRGQAQIDLEPSPGDATSDEGFWITSLDKLINWARTEPRLMWEIQHIEGLPETCNAVHINC